MGKTSFSGDVMTRHKSMWALQGTELAALSTPEANLERLVPLWRFSTAWYGTVRHGSVRYGTAQFGSVAFPPQFSTAIEWAGLFTRRYNCAASTAVTSS